MNLLRTIEARLLKMHLQECQKDENFKKAMIRGLTSCFFSAQSCSYKTRMDKRILEKRVWQWQVNTQENLWKYLGVVTVQLKTTSPLREITDSCTSYRQRWPSPRNLGPVRFPLASLWGSFSPFFSLRPRTDPQACPFRKAI